MLTLPPKFEASLGNGTRTSLFPLLVIYKDSRIDEPDTWDRSNSINISIKETNLDDTYFSPLLLKSPTISSSADLSDNKYKISSVSLSISNAPYKGEIFSDNVQSLLNPVCQVYFCSNGITKLEDCLLVYTGTIRRYSQSLESVNLTVEDITEQMLSVDIPSTKISEDDGLFRESDIGNPYPMVYGYVDKTPLIPESSGTDDMGELEDNISNLLIDKPGKEIKGYVTLDDSGEYGDTNLHSGHQLVQQGMFMGNDYLSSYGNGFVNIPRFLPNYWGPDHLMLGNSDDRVIYSFLHATSNRAASINIFSHAIQQIGTEDNPEIGIPSRIYRPFTKLSAFTYCDEEQDGDRDSINKIYGFTNYEYSSTSPSWKPWKLINDFQDVIEAYDNDWSEGGTFSWWEPTNCNSNTHGGTNDIIDSNWVGAGRDGKFPISRIQNGNWSEGIYFAGSNCDGEIGVHYKTGGSYVRLMYDTQDVDSLPCVSKIFYDAEYHSADDMDDDYKLAMPGAVWAKKELISWSEDYDPGQPHGEYELAEDLQYDSHLVSPFIPDHDSKIHNSSRWSGGNDIGIYYAGQTGTEDSIRGKNLITIIPDFNNTNSYESIQFGVPQLPEVGNVHGNDQGFCSLQLYNAYLLQDVVLDNVLDREFYASIEGRIISGEVDGIIDAVTSAYTEDTGQNNNMGFPIYKKYFIVDNYNKLREYVDTYGEQILSNTTISGIGDFYDGTYPGMHIDDSIQGLFMTYIYFGVDYDSWEGDTGVYETMGSEETILVENNQFIVADILKDELNYKGDISFSNIGADWKYSFTLSEQKSAKSVIEGIFKSSVNIASFNSSGQFKFIDNLQLIPDESIYPFINIDDVLKYSFELTKIDEVYNQVSVKYKENYGSGGFDKETGFGVDVGGTIYETYDEITAGLHPDEPEKHYNIEYYNLEDSETKLEVESEYIRDEATAKKLQKRLYSFYANQHLVVKFDLPVTFLSMEVGDYFRFDRLLGGTLAFGQDYTKSTNKNGQLIYSVFFITSIKKSLDKVKVEAIQMHRGDFGFPEEWEEGNTTDNEDIIIDEVPFSEETTDNYINASWLNVPGWDSDFKNNPTISLETNVEEDWNYSIWITFVSDDFIVQGDESSFSIQAGTYLKGQLSGDFLVNSQKVIYDEDSGNYSGMVNFYSRLDIPDGVVIYGKIGIYNADMWRDDIVDSETYTELPFQHTYSSWEPTIGDINSDGIINVQDLVYLVQHILSEEEATDLELYAGDFNQDGGLNILDVVQLVNYILEGGS